MIHHANHHLWYIHAQMMLQTLIYPILRHKFFRAQNLLMKVENVLIVVQCKHHYGDEMVQDIIYVMLVVYIPKQMASIDRL